MEKHLSVTHEPRVPIEPKPEPILLYFFIQMLISNKEISSIDVPKGNKRATTRITRITKQQQV